MYTNDNPFVVAEAPSDLRASFYRKTYGLVALSFLAWALLLAAFFYTGLAAPIVQYTIGMGRFNWLITLGLFWLVTSFAQKLSFTSAAPSKQYLGLGLYILAEAIIFVPLIALVAYKTDGHIMEILAPAGATTGLLILGLTVTVFFTNTDFSFLKSIVVLGTFFAFGAILVFIIFGINPGTWFAIAMTLLMAAAILWQTHQVKTQCDTSQHVPAALVLFAGFITLLWYVIQIFLSRRN